MLPGFPDNVPAAGDPLQRGPYGTDGILYRKEGITQAMINQRELDIIGSRMSQDAFEPTIARMEKGEYITEGIATTFIKFSEIDKVFHLMDHPDESAKKMVILFD